MRESTTFGQYLKKLRRGVGLTQEELALRAQCSGETIRKVEAGKRRPAMSLAQKLATVLQLDDGERTDFLQLARSELATGASAQEQGEAPSASTNDPAPLLATKLYVPQPRTHKVVRPRLLTRLDGCLRTPLTLLAAPAGFGKSTLLTDWIHQPGTSPRHIAWVALDASDSDPVQFLRYLISALQKLAPAIGASLLPLLRSAQPPPLQPLLSVLVNDLIQLPDDSLVVLDDYHVIDTPAVHQTLGFLLEHLPPQLHLIIASRVNPPLPLSRMRARGQLVEIRAADLRFTVDEVATFLQEVMGLPLSAQDVAAIEARTEGWVAGLQLAAISLQEVPVAELSRFINSFTGSHRYVVDYLVDEVLANQPAQIQSFLLNTSVLDRLCAPLCAAMVGMTAISCQQLLEQLERANLFIVPLDEERQWYRYHHLFAQVLQERLLRSTSREEVARLHHHAASWFGQLGHTPEAVRHTLAAQDWEGAADLIEAHGWTLLIQGHLPQVRKWLDLLPEKALQHRPFLLELKAVLLYLTNNLVAAEEAIQAAEDAVLESDPNDKSRLLIAYATMMRANIARARGDIARCVELSSQAYTLLPVHEVIRRSVSTLGMALIFRVTGDVGSASEQLVSDAVDATRRAGNLSTYFNAMVAWADFHSMQGQLRQAAVTLQRASEVSPELLALQALNNASGYYCGIGAILYEWNEIEECERHILRGIELIRGGLQTHGDVVTSSYLSLARLQQMRGHGDEALATLHELRRVARDSSFATYLQERVNAAVAHLALQQGDLETALRWAETFEGLEVHEFDYLREKEWFTFVRIRLAQWGGNRSASLLAEVIALLDRLLVHAEGHRRKNSVIHLLMLRALAMQAQDNVHGAANTLVFALQLAAPERYVRLFVDEGNQMARLLTQVAATRKLEPSVRQYVETLLRVLHEEGNGLNVEKTTLPSSFSSALVGGESLTVREMTVLQLLAVGKSNRTIAEELVVEVGTVKRHVSNILDKLQVQSRLEAVIRAKELNLLSS